MARISVAAGLLLTATWSAAAAQVAKPATAVVGATGRFSPVTPVRILDTRSGLGAPKGQPEPFEPLAVTVRGANGVPADATAVLVNLTLTDGEPSTSVYVYGCDDIGDAGGAILDPTSATANLVATGISDDGAICFETFDSTHVVADLAGWYGPTGTSGFNSLTPTRLVDTRLGQGAPKAPVATGAVLTVKVAGQAGVPPDATAAALNVTATQTQASGYVTAFPCDKPRPTASNLNFDKGDTVPNLVVVPLAADGTICLFSYAASDLIVDASGWFGATGKSFTPIGATDADDTLLFSNSEGEVPLAANQTVAIKVRGVAQVPATAPALAVSIAASGPQAGYITVYPCDQPRPTASNLNYAGFDAKVATAMVPIAADGTVCLYTYAPIFVWVGALGFYTA